MSQDNREYDAINRATLITNKSIQLVSVQFSHSVLSDSL